LTRALAVVVFVAADVAAGVALAAPAGAAVESAFAVFVEST